VGVCVGGLGGGHDSGASDVSEWDGGRHLEGDASGKRTDLFMDVHEEGVGLPTAHLSNGVGVDSIQVHGHGSAGP
jgi:hypothetical protein